MHPTPLRFLALGDSYTIGEGVAPEERWTHQLAATLRAEGIPLADPVTVARTGWTADELRRALDERPADAAGRFDLVTVLIGVNNQYRGHPVEQFEEELTALWWWTRQLTGGDDARVLVLSIPDWGVTPFAEGRDRGRIEWEIDAYNQVVRGYADGVGARWVDVTPISREQGGRPEMLAADGLHPAGAMYARWAELAAPAAREILR